MLFRMNWTPVPVALAMLLSACSGGGDSLKREQASMEQEAKALAQHEAPKPSSSGAPAGGTPLPKLPMGIPGEKDTGVKIPSGLEFQVAPTQALSSRTAQTGADWPGKLVNDLTVDGVLIARAGSEVVGRFLLVSDATRLRKKHELELRIYKLKTTKGEFVDVRTLSFLQEGEGQGRQPVVITAGQPLTFKMGSGQTLPR